MSNVASTRGMMPFYKSKLWDLDDKIYLCINLLFYHRKSCSIHHSSVTLLCVTILIILIICYTIFFFLRYPNFKVPVYNVDVDNVDYSKLSLPKEQIEQFMEPPSKFS